MISATNSVVGSVTYFDYKIFKKLKFFKNKYTIFNGLKNNNNFGRKAVEGLI